MSGLLTFTWVGADADGVERRGESQVAFIANKKPWCWSTLRISARPDSGFGQSGALIQSWRDEHLWSVLDQTGGIVDSVDMPTTSIYDYGLRPLLEPAWLRAALSDHDQTDLIRADLLGAPRLLELGAIDGLGLIDRRADFYQFELDEELGIISSWTALLEGSAVRSHEIHRATALTDD